MKKFTFKSGFHSLPLLFATGTLLAWTAAAPPAAAEVRADLPQIAGDSGEARLFTSLSERRALDGIQPPPVALVRGGEPPFQIQPETKTVDKNPAPPLLLPTEAAAPASGAPPSPVIDNRDSGGEAPFEGMHFNAMISRRGWARLWVNGERAEEGKALVNGLEWSLIGDLTARFRDRSGRSFQLFPGQGLASSAGGDQ